MRTKSRPFTPVEDDFISTNYLSMPMRDIALVLERTRDSVQNRIIRTGVSPQKLRPFTGAEDAVILSGRGRTSIDIGKELGRAPSVVRSRARRLGIGSWKLFQGGLKTYRGYKVSRIETAGGVSRRVPEHRAVIESFIGRRLTDIERVHHINGNKRDNRINNLYLCRSDAEHSKAHHSITPMLTELLERGHIYFDRVKGIYQLCEISK